MAEYFPRVIDPNVLRILEEGTEPLVPYKIVDGEKVERWNTQLMNSITLQHINAGDGMERLARNLASGLGMSNYSDAVRNARTALTASESRGQFQSMRDARQRGIKLKKQWIAFLDNVTRDSHADVNEEIKDLDKSFSNGLMFPGDSGPPEEVYNCRCCMDEVFEGIDYDDWYSGEMVPLDFGGKDFEDTHKLVELTRGVLENARNNEHRATVTLQNAIANNSGHLEGLESRIKGDESLARKIRDKSAKRGMSREEYAGSVTDALRYTVVSPNDDFLQNFRDVERTLTNGGYRFVEITNTFGDHGAPYRGINTLVETPSGYVFELQFHTPQSLEIKEINHEMYEEQRLPTTSLERQRELDAEMARNANSIESPAGVDEIQNLSR